MMEEAPRLLISSCLLGDAVRYDGLDNAKKVAHCQQLLLQWRQQQRLISICPEVAGGMSVPRVPAEIQGGDGKQVLEGKAIVQTRDGRDVTEAFVAGAYRALTAATQHQVRYALLAARSPSCGAGWIHDGSFSGQLITGNGVTVALLEQHGIRCFTPEQFSLLRSLMDGH